MGFLDLFGNKKATVVKTSDSNDEPVSAERVVNQIPNTVLAYTPEQLQTFSSEDLEYYKQLNNKMPPLRLDEINFIPVEVGVLPDGGYYARVFIRNGTEEEFSLWKVGLELIDADGDVAAAPMFQTSSFGNLRLGETRLWTFEFSKVHLQKQNPDFSKYTIAVQNDSVEYKRSLQLDVPQEWKGSITEQQIQNLENLIRQLPKIQPNTINMTGLQIQFDEDGNLRVVVLIQNATYKDVTFHSVPLFVKDNADEVIVEGFFEMKDFTVKAYTIKPWMFVFNKELIKKSNPDFSRWIVFTK